MPSDEAGRPGCRLRCEAGLSSVQFSLSLHSHSYDSRYIACDAFFFVLLGTESFGLRGKLLGTIQNCSRWSCGSGSLVWYCCLLLSSTLLSLASGFLRNGNYRYTMYFVIQILRRMHREWEGAAAASAFHRSYPMAPLVAGLLFPHSDQASPLFSSRSCDQPEPRNQRDAIYECSG